ncbi:acyl-homoserine-lactone synthase [Litorisediminicola beolgyonensis]|uniref:Acyl-homoserine-lactone synthase n=1 Tax=Litorisediminicola beolgyonensis TaxID=1173614 RepID=A0ABW3ZDD7_9RHOB
MIIVIDGLNKDRYTGLLDQMYQLRARVFADRLGWDVTVRDGKEIDQFDALDPAYVLGVNDDGRVVACVRALQTTGPHMLADVFSDILRGEPPLRSATLWESTRFCVDTQVLERGKSRNSVSYATCALMAGSLEYAKNSGISDIVTVIDPVMNRVLQRSDCAPYGYVGETTPMGKVPAMAALLDCTDERIAKIRAFAGIEGDIFLDPARCEALADPVEQAPMDVVDDSLEFYCREQVAQATTEEERVAAWALMSRLRDVGMIAGRERLVGGYR